MLVGRRAERTRLDELLEGLSEGRSAALVLTGEPGIGKTALLEYTRRRGGEARILAASGFESERDLPYAGLSMLLTPVSDLLDEIPLVQRRALAAALGTGPPTGADRFAAYGGVLSLLAATAEASSVLVTVDDAHWLDAASAEALGFAARRLGEEGVGMVFAARDSESAVFDSAGLPEIHVGALDDEAAQALLRRASGGQVEAVVLETLQRATAGNPLALAELGNLLSQSQLEGSEPLPDPLPVGAEVERAFGRRLGSLPLDTQRALTVAATDATITPGALAKALGRLGIASDALVPAETANLVAIESGGIRFRHPLLRSAAYERAGAPERRAAHRALADTLGAKADHGRHAWHLAAATVRPDEEVAAELEEAAREAHARGAPAAAGAVLEAAARVTPADDSRIGRLLGAAEAFGLAGDPEAARPLLDSALSGASGDPLLRADVQRIRAAVEAMSGSPGPMRELLLAEAERVRPHDDARAAVLLLHATLFSIIVGDLTNALELARDAFPVARELPGTPALAAHVFLAGTLVMAGYSNEARPLIDSASRLAEEADLFSVSVVMPALALGYQWTEQYERAGRVITAVVAQSRQQGAVVALPFALAAKAEIELRVGNWTSAYAAAAESTALAEDTRQRAELSHSLARLAQVEACLGREADCRRHAERCIEICDELGIVAARMLAGWTLGLLELGGGRLDVAVEHLEPTGSKCTDHGLEQPAVIPWAQDLTEAHVRLDDWKPAQETLATLERQARRTRARVTRATAARCRALLTEDDDEAGRLFGRALALHDGRPAPFEHARTELCFGERLRRARRRSDAREHLRRALGTFERLGAAPWAERARRELAASGERARRRASDTRDELTAHELQVALVVAEGATNREAAAQLFVSPKTIETHLTHIYRKLGIRSRTELAHRLGADFERR